MHFSKHVNLFLLQRAVSDTSGMTTIRKYSRSPSRARRGAGVLLQLQELGQAKDIDQIHRSQSVGNLETLR